MLLKISPEVLLKAEEVFEKFYSAGKRVSKVAWDHLRPLLEKLGFLIVRSSKGGARAVQERFAAWQSSARSLPIVPANAQFLGTREKQEDALGCSDIFDREFVRHGGVLAVVADGMGGMAYGREASHAAVQSFLKSYLEKPETESVEAALLRSLRSANDSVVRRSMALQAPALIGTTLVAAVCVGRKLHWISVGDSRAYLLRDGAMQQLTTDHVYGVELDRQVEEKLIPLEEARDHPEREHLTSYLGEGEVREINKNDEALELRAGDRILLCTDGVYRSLSEEEVRKQAEDVSIDLAEGLVSMIREKKLASQDNATVIALSCGKKSGTKRSQVSGRLLRPAVLFWLVAGCLMWLIWEFSKQPHSKPEAQVTQPESK